MCLAIPLQIIKIEGNKALGDAMGIEREIRLDLLPDAKIGDYVIVHAGFAIEKLSEEQANEDYEVWGDIINVLI